MWMPTGSFWAQPAGGVHITAATGNDILAYIEIEKGPYLVLPVEKAFESEDEPINVLESNIVWSDPSGAPASANGPAVARLWGDPLDAQPSGTLLKLPAGSSGVVRSHGTSLQAVVIEGRPSLRVPGETDGVTLEPGSFFSSKGESVHRLSTEAEGESVVYVRVQGTFDVAEVPPEQ
jgi:hypothetical protein